MGIQSGSSQTCFASDVASIASTGNSAASPDVIVPVNAQTAYLQLYLTGNGAGSGLATAYVVTSLDGTNYSTDSIPIPLTIASGAKRSNPIALDVKGLAKLKILNVNNGDPAQAITAVNVAVSFY